MKNVLAVSMLLLGILGMSFMSEIPSGYAIGDTARDFSLKNVNGKNVSLSGIKDAKGYIVVFTCNNCPYAKAYEDRIIKLQEKYGSLGYPVVAINSNDPEVAPADSYAKMKERAKSKKFPFVYLYDSTQEIAKTYGATRTPHVFVLDNNRVVRYIGAIDDNSEDETLVKEKYVENAVDAMRSGQEIAVKETKAIGCGIKWKKS